MIVEFTDESVLRVIPETSIEAMALKYWEKEFEAHGVKMFEVETKTPHADS